MLLKSNPFFRSFLILSISHLFFRTERDRNDEIQQLIARAELHARQYMSTFNLHHFTTNSTIARIVPIASSSGVFS